MNGILPPGAEWLPFLAALAAKATLVLALTALAAALLWRASAAARHLVWLTGIVGVLALPAFSLLLPRWEVPVLPAASSASTPSLAEGASAGRIGAPETVVPRPAVMEVPAEIASADAPQGRTAWMARAAALLVLGGVAAGLGWLAMGFWGVARLGRRAEVVRDAEWLHAVHESAARLGLRRPVLLLRARGAVMPATGGIVWPSVVIPSGADAWPHDRRRAVLAHELAHVKRFDCLTQALAQVACALFWWHPAVWYAARRLRVERERACDDLVLGTGTRASDYASHLLEIARTHRGSRMAAPALVSMARPSHLESRLLWVLDAARSRGAPSPRATLLTVLAAGLLVLPLSALRPTEASARPASARADGTGKDGAEKTKPDAGKKEGIGALAELRVQAHAEASASARAAADTFPDDSLETLIALRALGVDDAYVRDLRAAGYDNLSARELVELAATDVTGAYAGEMNAAGWGRLTPDQLQALGAVGVTTAWLGEMRAAGIRPATADDAAELRALDVTAAYVRELERAGLRDLAPALLGVLRASGVDAAFIAEMRAAGLRDLDAETLAQLGALGVDARYIRSLEEVGLRGLTAGELTELRGHHVDADYVREVRAAGFADLTADQLVRLRASGVDRELINSRRGQQPARP
ncbi:M56 family metallopeptidase [Longimicrobium sp.]|uniref:M56 family metallopeptidase n=1 Tax=Longimicrobium sp. TaxID=2029185 RepID=UPI002E314EA7|nr:M56 family metallopeptidase [Longimicrobium sp.]HEX6037031.1 M56 family metallopeptidase [Longimicrobium sp.]